MKVGSEIFSTKIKNWARADLPPYFRPGTQFVTFFNEKIYKINTNIWYNWVPKIKAPFHDLDSAYKQIKINVSPNALKNLGKTKQEVMDSVYDEFKIQRTVSKKPGRYSSKYISDMEELILSPRAAFFLSEEPAHPPLIIGNLWLILVLPKCRMHLETFKSK